MSERTDRRAEAGAARRMTGRRRTEERLVALLVVGIALLNYPLLSVMGGRAPIAGIPAHVVYLFAVWALLVGATALALRGRPPDFRDGDGGGGPDPGTREP